MGRDDPTFARFSVRCAEEPLLVLLPENLTAPIWNYITHAIPTGRQPRSVLADLPCIRVSWKRFPLRHGVDARYGFRLIVPGRGPRQDSTDRQERGHADADSKDRRAEFSTVETVDSVTRSRRSKSVACRGLTGRECDVLAGLAEGLSDREIAARLSLSKSTIKTHLKILYRRFNLRNRAQAAVFGYQRGVLNRSSGSQGQMPAHHRALEKPNRSSVPRTTELSTSSPR